MSSGGRSAKTPRRRPYIALVGIHGVGSAAPGETARALGDLLATQPSGGTKTLAETALRIVEACPAISSASRPNDEGLEIIARQLEHLHAEGWRNVHATVRVELELANIDVHAYEARWSDVAKSDQATPLAVLLDLLAVPASLLRIAQASTEHARASGRKVPWGAARPVEYVSFLVGVVVPVLTTMFLAARASAVSLWLPMELRPLAVSLLMAAALSILAAQRHLTTDDGRWSSLQRPCVVAPLVFLATFAVTRLLANGPVTSGILVAEMFAALAMGAGVLVRRISGSPRTWKVVAIASLVALAGSSFTAAFERLTTFPPSGAWSSDEASNAAARRVLLAVLGASDALSTFLVLGWATTFVCIVITVLGSLGTRGAERSDAWTRVLAIVSAFVSWGLLQGLALGAVETPAFEALVGAHYPADGHLGTLCLYALKGGSFVLPIGLVPFVCVASLVVAVTIGPSVLHEIGALPTAPATDVHSARLGSWLTRGMAHASWLGALLVVSALVLPFAVPLVLLWSPHLRVVMSPTRTLWALSTAAVVTSLPAILRSRDWMTSAWAVLGIVFDIHAYVRMDGTGLRARMLTRTLSVLEHVDAWRDEAGQGYDAVIVVAHSQGTVIASDALRARRQLGLWSEARPTWLFTMGSPLRALYAAWFPFLYEWIDRATDASELGVRRWRNVYRSGDYIGRALAGSLGARLVEDVCLGAGAHMAYWRDRAVGAELTRLMIGIATHTADAGRENDDESSRDRIALDDTLADGLRGLDAEAGVASGGEERLSGNDVPAP